MAYFAHGQVESAALLDVGLVVVAELQDVLDGGVHVELVEVARRDVNLVEECLAQAGSGARCASFIDGEELIEVEHDYVLETYFALLVELDEFLVNLQGVVARTKAQYALACGIDKAAYGRGNFFCNIFGTLR